MPDRIENERRTRILDGATTKFSAYGFARTSMADIAEVAGMSRPALYQYYANKEEIFAAMLVRIMSTAADQSLAALSAEGDLETRLDGFLQRGVGDLVEQFRSTEHGNDLVEAKQGQAKTMLEDINRRVRREVSSHLAKTLQTKASSVEVVDLTDLLLLAPGGLKYDNPSIAKYRRRLSALAGSVASATDRVS